MDPFVWTVAYAATVVIATLVAVAAWRARAAAPVTGRALAATSAAVAGWSSIDLGITLAPQQAGPALLVAIIPATQVCIGLYAVLLLAVADPRRRPTRRFVARVAAVPVVVTSLALTNGLHHLVFVSVVGNPVRQWVDWEPGPVVAVHVLWNYAMLVYGVVVAVRARRFASPLHRRQLDVVVLGVVLPIVGNVICLAGPWRNAVPDLSGVFFAGSMLLFSYAVFRQGMVRLVPIARGAVLDGLADAVVVLDPDGLVLDVNRSADALLRELTPGLPVSLVGLPATTVLGAGPRPGALGWPVADGEHVVRTEPALVLDVRSTPLLDGGRETGQALVVRDVTQAYTQRAALAAANQRLTEQVTTIDLLRAELAEQAVRDELTGLHNRRFLTDRMQAELTACATQGAPVSVVLLDVDHFKQVNDTYGHAVGDDVLRAVAQTLRASVRDGDVVARYGGEEFVVLLPRASADVAAQRAENWRLRVGDIRVETPGGTVMVTISAGVSDTTTGGLDPKDLLKAADDALYRAKAAGRDRVVLAAG